jgi:hypothetical protein
MNLHDRAQDYISHFEPLLLEECGALLMRGNDEGVIAQPMAAALAGVEQACTTPF